jgi:hypothetical protein
LAWNHDDVSPNRSRDELLGEVVRRGERLRRRQRLVAGLGGSITVLLAVAGVAAIAGVGPGDESSTQLAAGGRTTTSVAYLNPATGGTVFALDGPTTTAATPVPVAGVAPTPTTVPTAGTTVLAVEEPTQAPVTSPTAAVTTVAAAGPAQPRCSPATMSATITLAPSYRQGEPIVGSAVLRNTSGAPCYYYSYTAGHAFKDANGTEVGPSSTLIADAFEDTPFATGQTLTDNPSWDQQFCPAGTGTCSPAPPGTYTATVTWSFDGPPIQATATFTIVP